MTPPKKWLFDGEKRWSWVNHCLCLASGKAVLNRGISECFHTQDNKVSFCRLLLLVLVRDPLHQIHASTQWMPGYDQSVLHCSRAWIHRSGPSWIRMAGNAEETGPWNPRQKVSYTGFVCCLSFDRKRWPCRYSHRQSGDRRWPPWTRNSTDTGCFARQNRPAGCWHSMLRAIRRDQWDEWDRLRSFCPWILLCK